MGLVNKAGLYISICISQSAHVVRWSVRWLTGYRGDVRGVRAIIINDNSQVLLLRQWHSPFAWVLPGGGINYKESSIDAVIRESYEETGLTISSPLFLEKEMGKLGDEDYTKYYVIRFFTGSLSEGKNFEIISRRWFAIKNLPENIFPNHKFFIEKATQEMQGSSDAD